MIDIMNDFEFKESGDAFKSTRGDYSLILFIR